MSCGWVVSNAVLQGWFGLANLYILFYLGQNTGHECLARRIKISAEPLFSDTSLFLTPNTSRWFTITQVELSLTFCFLTSLPPAMKICSERGTGSGKKKQGEDLSFTSLHSSHTMGKAASTIKLHSAQRCEIPCTLQVGVCKAKQFI